MKDLVLELEFDDKFEGDIDTIYSFETSSSKRFSIKKYESTKLQKPIYGPSRVQLLVQNLSLKKATNIGWISQLRLDIMWSNTYS